MRNNVCTSLLLLSLAACSAASDTVIGARVANIGAQAVPDSSKTYRILSASSHKSVDIPNGDPSDGVYPQQWGYWGGKNQRWRFVPLDNGLWEIVSAGTNSCLGIDYGRIDDGTRIQQWQCIEQDNQQWRIKEAPGGYNIVASNGKCLDLYNNSGADGTKLQQWTCWGGVNQLWNIEAVDASGNPVNDPPSPTTSNFGNLKLHPEKIAFYMVPDLEPAYKAGANSPAGACAWTTTQASLNKLHQLLPNAWLRWDNETGHYSDDPGSVETFVSCANNAGVGMIITGTAIDGYNNWWANGNRVPNASLLDFANGPYVAFAAQLASRYPVVKFVETANEPDGPWFNNDGDNVDHFNYYVSKLGQALGGKQKILGPSVATIWSQIWSNYLSSGATNLSYHTYGGADALTEFAGRKLYITEYGGFDLNPAAVLADLYAAETRGKLSGTIEKLFYQQITDNGGNRGAFNSRATENGHFALRDWFRALTLFQALGNVSVSAYANAGAPDHLATDNGKGGFAALLWNNGGGALNTTRQIGGVSLASAGALNVLHLGVGDAKTAQCASLGSQSWVKASLAKGTVSVSVNGLEPHAALLVTTQSCAQLAD